MCQRAKKHKMVWPESSTKQSETTGKRTRRSRQFKKNPLDETRPRKRRCEAKGWKCGPIRWVGSSRTRPREAWRTKESQKQTRSLRHYYILYLSLFIFMSLQVEWKFCTFKNQHLSISSSIFVVFGVIKELTCWINKHTKTYSFCSSTHLIEKALERFTLRPQSPEVSWNPLPPSLLKLRLKGLRLRLCFKIPICLLSVRAN